MRKRIADGKLLIVSIKTWEIKDMYDEGTGTVERARNERYDVKMRELYFAGRGFVMLENCLCYGLGNLKVPGE